MNCYDQNRAKFSTEELQQYEGQWVAFSAEGSKLVAHNEDFDVLEEMVIAAGEDPEQVWYERIIFESEDQAIVEFV